MAGGDADEIDRAQHLFLAMGKSLHRTGGLGSGHAMKALNNFLSASSLAAMCEALLVGQAFGLDPTTMIDVFNSSSGMSNSTQLKGKQHIISGTFSAGFTMGLMAKDLGTAAGIAEHVKLSTPMLADQANLWREAASELGAAADHTAIYKHQAKKAGAPNAG
jgi:3-hydroxyisobutyrate dehydrogenase